MFRILVADSLPEVILEKYTQFSQIEIDNQAGISAEQLQEILPGYDALIVRSRSKVTTEVLQRAHKLKAIGRAGAGVDNIDVKEATRRGIIVMNTPGANTIAATEHTIALMLSVLRNIPQASASVRQKKWDRKTYLGNELFEKNIGIIGLGKIGREVARRLAVFGTHLIGYDPILTQEMADRLAIRLTSFDHLIRNADIITIHVPKTSSTVNLLNAENLKHCKKNLVLINCARGGIVNEQDLIAALNSGKVQAAGIDVFESEPPEYWELSQHPKVVATPHLGASTREAQVKVADQILQQMITYFQKHISTNAVNFISVDTHLHPMITPYFCLAEKLGMLFSQIRDSRLKEIAIHFYGDILDLPVEPITSHLLIGALKPSAASPEILDVELLNVVNAMAIAREKGIEIEITKKKRSITSHTNLIACDFHTETGTIRLAGTVYAKDIYRLVIFNRYNVDAELNNKMVIVENKDLPGIIGNVGTILAQRHINIGQVSSGRILSEQAAINIFNVDGSWDQHLRSQLATVEHVENVLLVDFEQ